MRTWILFSAFWLAETINPNAIIAEPYNAFASLLFIAAVVIDGIEISRKL